MIALIIAPLLVVLLLYYLSFLWQVQKGLKFTVRPSHEAAPFVSIIVAARNEEKTIAQCLDSLARQTYDSRKYEIVVVNDHSTDNTAQFVKSKEGLSRKPSLSLYSLADADGKRCGKPAAIALGIERSKGEIILCTDADCTVTRGWATSMVGCFQPGVAFVAGPVRELPSDSFLSALQRLEFLGLITTAAGLIGSGKPIICNGANIAYRRDAFEQVSGFGPTSSSCDDETLMQRMIQRKVGRVVFNVDPEALVQTRTPSTVLEFLNQRMRWASKRGHYEDGSILLRLICLFAFFGILFAAGVASLIDSSLGIPFLSVLLVKVTAELAVLNSGATLFNQRMRVGQFLIAELFHVPYIVFAALIGQFSSLRWKDRNLKS